MSGILPGVCDPPAIVARCGDDAANLVQILRGAQESRGSIPPSVLDRLAALLGVARARPGRGELLF